MPEPVKIGRLPRWTYPLPGPDVAPLQQSAPYSADFTSEQTFIVNMGIQQGQQVFGPVKSIQVDSNSNPNNIVVTVPTKQFKTTIPAFASGYFPVVADINDDIYLYSEGGADELVNFTFYNYFIPPAIWYTTDPISPGFDVQALLPIMTSLTKRTATLVAGAAQNIFPAIASANFKCAKNMTDGVLYWNVNITATGDPTIDYQMNPGEGFNGTDIQLMFRTAQRISMYSAIGGRVEAFEWSNS